MKEKMNKENLLFHQRHPELPLIMSICSLICSIIVLLVSINVL